MITIDSGQLLRFSAELSKFIGLSTPMRSERGTSSSVGAQRVRSAQVEEFRLELDRFLAAQTQPSPKRIDSQVAVIPPRASALPSVVKWRELSSLLKNLREGYLGKIGELRESWPSDPRLSDESVLGPLGLTGKEVPLTRAIAWLIGPANDGPVGSTSTEGFHADCLASFLNLLPLFSQRRATRDCVATWVVSTESAIADDSRIDLLIEGYSGGVLYQIGVEAKIRAPEGKGQSSRYLREVSHLVWLTMERPDPPERAIPLSYSQLLAALLPVLLRHQHHRDAALARLLLADISRDLTNLHVGSRSPSLRKIDSIEFYSELKDVLR